MQQHETMQRDLQIQGNLLKQIGRKVTSKVQSTLDAQENGHGTAIQDTDEQVFAAPTQKAPSSEASLSNSGNSGHGNGSAQSFLSKYALSSYPRVGLNVRPTPSNFSSARELQEDLS